MSRLNPQILDRAFLEWSKTFRFVDKPDGSGFAVTFFDPQTSKERVIRAPSYKFLWKKEGHAKAAFRRDYGLKQLAVQFVEDYHTLKGTYLSRAERDELWDYVWTRLEIKQIGRAEPICEAIKLLKSGDVNGAIGILEGML